MPFGPPPSHDHDQAPLASLIVRSVTCLVGTRRVVDFAAAGLFGLSFPWWRRFLLGRKPRRNGTRRRNRGRRGATVMCPIRPGAPMPTAPGVYWRDTARWVRYPLDVSAKILDALDALHAAEGPDTTPENLSSREVEVLSPVAKRRKSPPRARPSLDDGIVNLGPVGGSAGGGDYVVDLRRGVQLSPRGFAREVHVVRDRGGKAPPLSSLFIPCVTPPRVEPAAPFPAERGTSLGTSLGTSPSPSPSSSPLSSSSSSSPTAHPPDELSLHASLAETVKALYVGHVDAFVAAGRTFMNGGARPDLKLNPHLWNVRAANVRAFLRAAVRAGGTPERPGILLGYHGTPAKNSDAIFREGFRPECRRSHGDGAYFSGELSYSVSYARKGGGTTPGDVLLVALIQSGNASGVRRKAGDTHLIDAQGTVFKEETALPLARLRGF